MPSVPKPKKKSEHKWDARGQCKRCRLLLHPLVEAAGCKTGHKFGAQRTVVDGQSFPSKLEASTWSHFKILEKGGLIKELTRKATVIFPGLDIKYQADMKYTVSVSGQTRWVEAKGKETDRWRIVKKLWKVHGPGVLEVYKAGRNGRIVATEVILPREMELAYAREF